MRVAVPVLALLFSPAVAAGSLALNDQGSNDLRVFGGARVGGIPYFGALHAEVDWAAGPLHVDVDGEVGGSIAETSGPAVGFGTSARAAIALWKRGTRGKAQGSPVGGEYRYRTAGVPKRLELGPSVGVGAWAGPAMRRWAETPYVWGAFGLQLHERWAVHARTASEPDSFDIVGRRLVRAELLVGPDGELDLYPASLDRKVGWRVEYIATTGWGRSPTEMSISAGQWPRLGWTGTVGIRFRVGRVQT